jgi:hypothetical protein
MLPNLPLKTYRPYGRLSLGTVCRGTRPGVEIDDLLRLLAYPPVPQNIVGVIENQAFANFHVKERTVAGQSDDSIDYDPVLTPSNTAVAVGRADDEVERVPPRWRA